MANKIVMHAVPPAEGQPGAPAGAFISERLRNPGAGDDAQAPTAPAGNYTVAGICAIVATILFVVMIFIMYQDLTILSNA